MDYSRFDLMNKYVARLNTLYIADLKEYEKILLQVKLSGFKVFRNSSGNHKLEDIGDNAFYNIFSQFREK